MNEQNQMTAPGLHAVLAEGAELITFGPVPSDAVLAGARRRTVRARATAVAAGALVLGGVGTGISVAGAGDRAARPVAPPPASSAASTPPPWTPATWTVVHGLAAGQALIHDPGAPYGDDPGTVILSGVVNGVPWQLRGASVKNPTSADKGWAAMAGPPSGTVDRYCEYMKLEVGSADLRAGFFGCGGDPDFGSVAQVDVLHSDGPYRGGGASVGFVRVPVGTARVELVVDGGPPTATTPAAVTFGAMPIAVFPLAAPGLWTVRAFDASGKELGIYVDPSDQPT